MSEQAPEGETPSAFAQEVWDDESPAQGDRLGDDVVPGTSQDAERGPDAWLESRERQRGRSPLSDVPRRTALNESSA
jgi:hypothetical protein